MSSPPSWPTSTAIAASGALTTTRVKPLWLILQRNREWWTGKPLPANGARMSFPGSELVFQYYPGQGLQLQPLANFSKLNALWQGKIYDDRLARLLDELLAIAAERGGGIAWEYYFKYAGGSPPWISGLAQGTAVQALARAGIRLQRKDEVFAVADRALTAFETEPPSGVKVGGHYLLYSFNPRLRVLNAWAQALVGLFDYGKYANDDRARGLFTRGEEALRAYAARYDTGAWSLYAAPGAEANLNYHQLNGQFLQSLCTRLATEPYCGMAARFGEYTRQPPVLELVTARLRGGKAGSVRFRLSKISRVALTVVDGSGRIVHTASFAIAAHGTRSFAWNVPRKPGIYAVRINATDLAGNAGEVRGEIDVLKPLKKKPKRPPSVD